LRKGSLAYFEGRLKTRKWQDKDGTEKYTTEVIAHEMKMLGGKESGDAPAKEKPSQASAAPNSYAAAKDGRAPQKPSAGFDDMEDDIPL
jgi:single-strand DNA-binding protein